ncbi:hypothetical protein GN956_G15614 [Arapaima gigas]
MNFCLPLTCWNFRCAVFKWCSGKQQFLCCASNVTGSISGGSQLEETQGIRAGGRSLIFLRATDCTPAPKRAV